MPSTPSIVEICDRYSSLYTGAITDVLDEFGYHNQTLAPRIEPLESATRSAGVAFPVTGRPNRDINSEKNLRRILTMLSEVPEHSMLVYDTNDDTAAHIGELTANSLNERGIRGAVVDGGTRDVSKILQTDFPVFTRYRTPADCVPRWEIRDWGVEVTVCGVTVSPGDIVIGDADGVVVIPEGVRVDVLEEAEAVGKAEDKVRDAVVDGEDPLKAYEKYGEF